MNCHALKTRYGLTKPMKTIFVSLDRPLLPLNECHRDQPSVVRPPFKFLDPSHHGRTGTTCSSDTLSGTSSPHGPCPTKALPKLANPSHLDSAVEQDHHHQYDSSLFR